MMRLLATLLVALLSVQVHMGQETEGKAEPVKLRQLNNYKQWAGEELKDNPSKVSVETPPPTPATPKLKKHPNKWAQYAPRQRKKPQQESEVYERVRQGRNGRIRPKK